MAVQKPTISANTLLSLDADSPDSARSFGPLLTPPSLMRNSLLPPRKTELISVFTNSANTVASAITGTNTAMTDDTTNPIFGSLSPVANFAVSSASRRLFISNTNALAAVNMTGKIVCASYRVTTYASTSGFEFRIRLYSAGTPSSPDANYHTFNVVVDGTVRPIQPVSGADWAKISVAIGRFTAVGTGATLTAITYAAIEVYQPSNSVPISIALGSITAFENALTRAAVVIAFDGIYRSQWNNALPIMARHNLPATIFPVNVSANLRSEPTPFVNTSRILNVAASPVSPLIRITLVNPTSFVNGKFVATAGILGVTDNTVAMSGTAVYQISKIDSVTFDLVGSVFAGTYTTTSRADANFSVSAVTAVDQSATDTTMRVTVADAGVYEYRNLVTVLGVNGVSVNGTFTINRVDTNPTLSFTRVGSTFSGAYTGGGYVISGITSGNTFMNMKQVDNLQDVYGWQVGTYTNRVNTRADFIPYDIDGVAADYQNSQALLMSRGFRGIQDAVYFNDTRSDDVVYSYLKKNYRSLRNYNGAVTAFKNETVPVGDPQNVKSYGVFAGDSTAKIIQLIDDAIANKEMCMITFHEIERIPALFGNATNFLGYDIDSFQTIITAIATRKAAGTLDAMTLEQVFEISNGRYA